MLRVMRTLSARHGAMSMTEVGRVWRVAPGDHAASPLRSLRSLRFLPCRRSSVLTIAHAAARTAR